jgi:hypothetical protein
MPDRKLLAIVQELRDRAEEALAKAETFNDPDCKRLMRQIATTYEDVARRLEREAGAADKAPKVCFALAASLGRRLSRGEGK